MSDDSFVALEDLELRAAAEVLDVRFELEHDPVFLAGSELRRTFEDARTHGPWAVTRERTIRAFARRDRRAAAPGVGRQEEKHRFEENGHGPAGHDATSSHVLQRSSPKEDRMAKGDFSGDHARDEHRGGLSDNYARDGGWSGAGRADDYEPPSDDAEVDATDVDREPNIGKASE